MRAFLLSVEQNNHLMATIYFTEGKRATMSSVMTMESSTCRNKLNRADGDDNCDDEIRDYETSRSGSRKSRRSGRKVNAKPCVRFPRCSSAAVLSDYRYPTANDHRTVRAIITIETAPREDRMAFVRPKAGKFEAPKFNCYSTSYGSAFRATETDLGFR